MPFKGPKAYPFDENGILHGASNREGICGIFNKNDKCIYIGSSGKMDENLYSHLRGQSAISESILSQGPTHFRVETESDGQTREARRQELIFELAPNYSD